MFYLMDISLSYYAQPLQQYLPDQDFWMTASGRHLLYVMTGVEGPVLRSKLLFPKRDFQQYDVPETATSRPSTLTLAFNGERSESAATPG